eukprot:CAMPEP_0117697846 /NCGR_PEP_ID=MMETSP0804-20121206/29454_1 /TAXON_ID=1074897 /ORGANISM="Tetraselmis astigmatica, Strain CCMP880" /LENGTH=127 /DNA_ID=CAMNT_0005512139 /DNA_START=153 /DNA_END=532 /DNA_ORIENTATION=+
MAIVQAAPLPGSLRLLYLSSGCGLQRFISVHGTVLNGRVACFHAVAACGCRQVHRATLGRRVAAQSSFAQGTPVVVKVKHAGVDDAIRRDFAVMMGLAELASRIPALEHLRLKDNLHQFAAPLREQV